MDRFGQELPTGKDTAVTDNMIYITGIKDIGSNKREAGGEIGLVIPVDSR